MTKYRKKPVVIDAFKWTGGHDQTEDPKWIVEAIEKGEVKIEIERDPYDTKSTKPVLLINTLEGTMTAQQGDYIIKGIQGELYPCKPEIFEATYELEDENTENEILSLLEAIREEIDNSKNKNKSADVRNHYLENAKHYTEIIANKLGMGEQS